MGYCGHCGAQLHEGDEFCRVCGTAVSDVAPVAGPPADTSARKKGRIALIVAAIVLALLLLGGVVYLFAFSGATPKTQVSSTTGTQTTGTLGSGLSTASAGSSTAPVAVPASTTPNPVVPPKPPAPKPSPTANDVTHQATFITKTGTAGGAHTMTFDYVQFLTGSDAIKAATAHGDTVENDYYVVNDNPKLRTFPVASGVTIKLHPGDPSSSRIFTFSEFKALMGSGTATYGGQVYDWNSQQTYYINVNNGKVTRVENVWVP
jgi:hypothetical protein